MATLRRSGDIEEEWKHRGGLATSKEEGWQDQGLQGKAYLLCRNGCKVPAIRWYCCQDQRHFKDIEDSGEAATISDLAMATGGKNQKLSTHQSSSTSKKDQQHLEEWQRRNGNINVKWKHRRRISNIGGVAKEEWQYQGEVETSKEEWQHQRRRSSARLILSTDHHSHQDHSPQQAVLSGVVAQGDVQGVESG